MGGWNPDANAWELPTSEAAQLDNFLIQPGKLVMRGPVVVTADLSTWYPLNVAGVVMTATGELIGRKSSTGGQVDPWNAPLLLPASADLASGLTTGLWVVGGTVTSFALANADSIPGPRWINFDGLQYGLSYDSAGAAVQDASSSYYVKPTSLCTATKSPLGGSPSMPAATFANAALVGTTPWTIGSPNAAATAVQTATATSASWANVGQASPVSGGAGDWGDSGSNYVRSLYGNTPQTSAQLWLQNFGLAIPANAEILGVTIGIAHQATGATTYHNVDGVSMVVNGAVAGAVEGNGIVIPNAWAGFTLGSSTDLWGLAGTLTPAILNDPSFGFAYWISGYSAPGLMEADVGKAATVQVFYTVPTETQYLEGTTCGFALPSSATVQGIAVTVTRQCTGGSGNDAACCLVQNGAVLTTNRSGGALIPGAMSAVTFGGSTDLWGATWTYAQINAANFGAVYAAVSDGTVDVSSITVQVWWTSGVTININVLSNAPHGAFDLIGYQSRIWLLAGIDTPGAGTVHNPTALFFTNPIAPGGGSAKADWVDPVGGTTNMIVMDGDASDYGVGLALVRNGMIVFRRQSVYLLRGSTTANYALIPISPDIGCVDARSIVETDQGVYFMSTQGLMLTNGTRIVNVSGTVLHTLRSAVAAEQAAVVAYRSGYVSCQLTSQGQLMISIGVGAASGSYTPIFSAMYDPAAAKGGAWVRITSSVWASDGSQLSGNNYAGQLWEYAAPKRVVSIGDRYVSSIDDHVAGHSILDYNAGVYDQLPSGASPFVAIPAIWRPPTASITTAAKRTMAQGKRYYIDYQFSASALVPAVGWSLPPTDAGGVALDALQQAPANGSPALTGWVSGVTPVPATFIQRYNRDFWNDVTDFTFVVTWQDIARAAQAGSSVAEIYGMGFEFQHSRERR